jgi:hypothetical protein
MEIHSTGIVRKRELRHASRKEQPSTPLKAELTGSRRCEALGIVATGNTPVLVLCRELLGAGVNPDSALAVYRKGVLALRVRSIAEAARLVVEDGKNGRPQFRLMRPERRGAASLMRGNGRRVP